MSPITHFLTGWCTANLDSRNSRRERLMITVAGIIPDLDGLGIVAVWFNADALSWYQEYHRVFTHNIFFCLLVMGAGYALSHRKWPTALLMGLSFHLHLLADLMGSRGEDPQDLWPVHYLYPLQPGWEWVWSGQWPLVSWQNFSFTLILLGWIGILARRRGYSFLELISPRVDEAVVKTVRHRFPLG